MTQIIDLPQAITLDGSEVGVVVQDGVTKKATVSLMRQPQTPLVVKFNENPVTLNATELIFSGNVLMNGIGNTATVTIPVPEYPHLTITSVEGLQDELNAKLTLGVPPVDLTGRVLVFADDTGQSVEAGGVLGSAAYEDTITAAQVKSLYEANANTNEFSDSEKTKLSGIAAGAQVNTVNSVAGKTGAVTLSKTDVGLANVDNTSDLNKPVSTATQNALNAKLNTSEVGSTVASLVGGKVPLSQINDSIIGQVEYMGVWNAATNSPTLPATPTEKGHYYVTSVAGTFQSISYAVGDWIISNGVSWDKVDNTDAVSSVAGKTGAVSLVKADVGLSNVDNTSDAAKPVSTATQTALNLKANLASPAFTGTPTVPTQPVADNSTKVASTEFVKSVVASQSNGVSSISGVAPIIVGGTIGVPQISISNATTSVSGAMSAADKAKLDGIPTGILTGTRGIFTGIGNDFGIGGIEVRGDGNANTVFPTIGFHQPSMWGASLQLRAHSDFRFYAQGGVNYANVTAATFNGNASGLTNIPASQLSGIVPNDNLSGTYGVNITGNAATTTKLQTARKINGVSFDGSADIWGFGDLTVVNAAATGSVSVDFSQAGIYDYTLSGNTTLVPTSLPTLTNATRSYLIRVRQTGTARTLTWWGGITWIATATPPAPAANKMVEYVMSWDGTNWLGRKGASN